MTALIGHRPSLSLILSSSFRPFIILKVSISAVADIINQTCSRGTKKKRGPAVINYARPDLITPSTCFRSNFYPCAISTLSKYHLASSCLDISIINYFTTNINSTWFLPILKTRCLNIEMEIANTICDTLPHLSSSTFCVMRPINLADTY